MTRSDPLYAVRRIERYTDTTEVMGVGSKSAMEVRYAVVLRLEMVPANGQSGVVDPNVDHPYRDIYMKILPRKMAAVPGALIGFPPLDVEPHGLGHKVMPASHYFALHNAHMPRLELGRRAEQQQEVEDWHKEGFVGDEPAEPTGPKPRKSKGKNKVHA